MGRISTLVGLLAALVSGGLLAACSTGGSPAQVASAAGTAEARRLIEEVPAFAGERPSVIDSDGIYRLSLAEQEAFLDYYRAPKNRDVPGHKRIGEYLVSKEGVFNYVHETRTAGEVFQLAGGNCLSLANITTALARLAGVKVAYQLRDDIPVYEKQENVILRGEHVRSVLYRPLADLAAAPAQTTLDLYTGQRVLVIDYFPTGRSRYIRRISEAEFTAMYYRNIAVEALVAGDYSRSYWFVKESMSHAPNHSQAINMLAILHRRTGDNRAAEQIYLYGLELADEKLILLKNYRVLLNDQGRDAEAAEMNRRIALYKDADPFEWWFLAEDAYGEEKYSDALSYYRKSIEIAPYLHESYFGMAKTFYKLGRMDSARTAMRQAIENASRPKFRTLYEAKLKALSDDQ